MDSMPRRHACPNAVQAGAPLPAGAAMGLDASREAFVGGIRGPAGVVGARPRHGSIQAGAPFPDAATMGLEASRGASFGGIPGPTGVEGARPRHGSLHAGVPFNPAATMGLEAFRGAAFGGIPSPATEKGARSSFLGSGVQAGASDPAVHGMAGRRSSLARHIVHWGSVPANAVSPHCCTMGKPSGSNQVLQIISWQLACHVMELNFPMLVAYMQSPELIQKRTMGALAACIMEMQDNAERMRKLMSQYQVVHEFVPRHVVNELFVKLDEMAESLEYRSLQCQEALDANPRSPSEPEDELPFDGCDQWEEDEYLQDDASWCAENDIDFEEILDRRMN